jgi:Domain of unknown function DUF29
MVQRIVDVLPALYEADETAWLDAMAELIQKGQFDDLDYPHLQEYLTDMAKRDRREVKSRLTVLLTHLLKWIFQPENRTGSWHGSIIAQRQELNDLLASSVLRNHAENILADVYSAAVKRAAAETGLPFETFPGECTYNLDQLLSDQAE